MKMPHKITTLSIVLLSTSVSMIGSASAAGNRGPDVATNTLAANVAYATKMVAKYESVPAFTPPGPAFDAAAAKGKTIYLIPFNSSIPVEQALDNTEASIAKSLGLHFVDFTNEGQVSQYIQGFNAAIAAKANLIIISGGNTAPLQTQIANAEKHHIKVLFSHGLEAGKQAPGPTFTVGQPFDLAGDLEADYIVAQSGGHANVLILAANDVLATAQYLQTVRAQFNRLCPTTCKITVSDIPTTSWATATGTTVEDSLIHNSSIKWVMPLYDAEAEWAVPAIQQEKSRDPGVHLVSYNASTFALAETKPGGVIAADVGDSPVWTAYAAMDDAMRMLDGVAPIADENIGERIFTPANVASAGSPPAIGKGWGTAFVSGYRQLWGLSA